MPTYIARLAVATLSCWLAVESSTFAQRLEIPRRHDRPPGPPISASEAIQKMTVPPGFHVEIVAEEPDLVNPVAMAIDEKGRFWVTESLEYPRREPGVGRDRVKVLEDTDHDGRVDKVTTFAEGLNIPSGIAVGHGGVWVVNAPDLLFMEDTDGDLKADKTTTLLTGFGRTDTHELPSALTWGPDGWLYGLNGVFNYCDVHYTQDNPNYSDQHPGWKFTCVMWRIHPRTREFQLFAEGTSNPWGIAINNRGDFFISACVIDHLWHITEGAYYIRQGGPYPSHTWPLRSIVDHQHQKAAYCGITLYDSDAYPADYRNVLYMGNIHGGCLNSDIVDAKGSSYFGKPKPDLLTANDAWFMPVSQLTGPDGCLYVLDWYDQYHCYQDANADPNGVERAKGRLYRLVYDGDDPSAKKTRLAPHDLAGLDDDGLVKLLSSENGFERWTAQRLLAERSNESSSSKLAKLISDKQISDRTRMHALWTLGSMPSNQVTLQTLDAITPEDGVDYYSWSIRLLGDAAAQGEEVAVQAIQQRMSSLTAAKESSTVALACIPSFAKVTSIPATKRAAAILEIAGFHPDDETLQHVAYNLIRKVVTDADSFQAMLESYQKLKALGPFASQWAPLLLDWSLESIDVLPDQTAALAEVLLARCSTDPSKIAVLGWIHEQSLAKQGQGDLVSALKQRCAKPTQAAAQASEANVATMATLVLASFQDAKALNQVEIIALAKETNLANRVSAVQTIIGSQSERLDSLIPKLMLDQQIPIEQRAAILESLGRANNDRVASWLAENYVHLETELQPKIIELLTQRPAWTKLLLEQVRLQKVPADRFNFNQLRRIATFQDDSLKAMIAKQFGSIREGNSEERAKVVSRMRDMLGGMSGDPFAGRVVFRRVCSQCHVLHEEGYNVGPDITRNGRNNWQQLIQNVFDPSAVIGPGFQAVIVLTNDDRVLTGVPTEETDQAITLKMQGGKVESLSKDSIEEIKRSDVSLMPEQIENQMSNQEMADLFAYLALDKPPEDSTGVMLSGAPPQKVRSKTP